MCEDFFYAKQGTFLDYNYMHISRMIFLRFNIKHVKEIIAAPSSPYLLFLLLLALPDHASYTHFFNCRRLNYLKNNFSSYFVAFLEKKAFLDILYLERTAGECWKHLSS